MTSLEIKQAEFNDTHREKLWFTQFSTIIIIITYIL